MTCYRPIDGFRKAGGGFTLRREHSLGQLPMQIKCGQCMGCRVDRSREWALRCVHEAQLHEHNAFLTLTYSPEHLPADCGLNIRHLQLFMKRLRKHYGKVRFLACGEYGSKNLRPHYHVLGFGLRVEDQVPLRDTSHGVLYTSDTISRLWGLGLCSVGGVTYKSAAYVARYSMKKVTGRDQANHYQRLDAATGELVSVRPEFLVMSRRPGIGSGWFDRYAADAFPSDFLVHDGRKVGVPGFYTRKLKEAEADAIKAKRKRRALRHSANQTPERLAVREEVHASRLNMLKREMEE